MLFRNKRVTHIGSTVVPTSSSLEMILVLWVFFPENCDKLMVGEIADSLKFGSYLVFISIGKILTF